MASTPFNQSELTGEHGAGEGRQRYVDIHHVRCVMFRDGSSILADF